MLAAVAGQVATNVVTVVAVGQAESVVGYVERPSKCRFVVMVE